MPITVVSDPSTAFGPGAQITVRTDVSPFDIPDLSTWRVEIHPHPSSEFDSAVVMTSALWSADRTELQIWVDHNTTTNMTWFYARQVSINTNDPIDIFVQLLRVDSTELDSSTLTGFRWDTNTSSSKLDVTDTGLTTEQAQQLADVHNLVAPPFTTTGGAALPIDVGDLVVKPALKLLGIDTTVHTLTGSGTLDLPSILGFNTAWGLVLDVTSAPAGWGRKPGYVDSFNFRIGQFLYLVQAANGAGAMVIEEYRLHLEHFTWVFRETWGSAIAYYIDPPCEVQLRFLTAFTP